MFGDIRGDHQINFVLAVPSKLVKDKDVPLPPAERKMNGPYHVFFLCFSHGLDQDGEKSLVHSSVDVRRAKDQNPSPEHIPGLCKRPTEEDPTLLIQASLKQQFIPQVVRHSFHPFPAHVVDTCLTIYEAI